ncbi:hypothetical protein K458DRAFT_238457, partial [Lentithecium fluviatile CBS 122367]
YRSINVALHSQFDVEIIPEYRPRPQEFYTERGVEGKVPPLVDEKTPTCSVYIPVLPGSQFWIAYSISPPVPKDQQFLFKLFINGAHIVNWSTGKEQRWEGKTMFGLYERECEDGKKRIEKRVLCFTPPNKKTKQWTDVTDAFDESACMEIRVHRAHASKRVERKVEDYKDTDHGKSRRGIDLVNAGRAGAEQPKRFYKFALIDPTDQPFATFRYYYRTWDQIRDLGVFDDIPISDDSTEMSVIEPGEDATPMRSRTQSAQGESDVVHQSDPDGASESPAKSMQAYISTGAPRLESRIDSPAGEAHQRHSGVVTPPGVRRRLSVPPSCKLDPPKAPTRPLPSIPQKGDPPGTSYQPHPVYSVDEWVVRTPSPVKSIRESISTPPLSRRRGMTPTAWMSAIATTWKRRGMSSTEHSNGGDSRTTSRSVS